MKKTLSLITGVAIMSLGVAYLAIAWTEPASAPPESNIPAPLNTSINAQSKEGALVIGTNSGLTTGLVVQYGNVGIGTTDPGAKLEVEGNIIADIPTTDTHVATKGYVDAQAGGASYFSLSCGWISSGVPPAVGSCIPPDCPAGYSSSNVSCTVNALASTPTGSEVGLVPIAWYRLITSNNLNYYGAGGAGGSCYRVCYK